MGKIGSFDYPECKIRDTIEVARIIEERFGGRVEKQATLADVLGHSNERSGGFIAKVTALRRYGLATGRGELETTQLAKSAVFPRTQEEQTSAIVQAMENVELFKKIFERLGDTRPTDDFWVDLVEITGEERSIAQKDAIKIRNIYMDGHEYLVSAKKAEPKPKAIEAKVGLAETDTVPIPTEALFELRTKDYGTLIVKDEESIEVARRLIDIIEQRSKSKAKQDKID